MVQLNSLLLGLAALMALLAMASGTEDNVEQPTGADDFLSERLARASPLRWGKRAAVEALRWGKREPLRWGKRSDVGMQRMSRESPLRWGKRSNDVLLVDPAAVESSVQEPQLYRDLRESPLRWGKRFVVEEASEDKRAPLRWGKRAPSRFGKRAPSRFGKRTLPLAFEDFDEAEFPLADME